jgi:hypothetical protein
MGFRQGPGVPLRRQHALLKPCGMRAGRSARRRNEPAIPDSNARTRFRSARSRIGAFGGEGVTPLAQQLRREALRRPKYRRFGLPRLADRRGRAAVQPLCPRSGSVNAFALARQTTTMSCGAGSRFQPVTGRSTLNAWITGYAPKRLPGGIPDGAKTLRIADAIDSSALPHRALSGSPTDPAVTPRLSASMRNQRSQSNAHNAGVSV